MSVEGSSRALRMVVAELAELADDDAQAIVAELDPASRQRLTTLLDAYRKGEAPLHVPQASASRLDLSPWLIDRLSGQSRPDRLGSMTLHAAQALKRIAAAEGWTPPPAASTTTRISLEGLIARIGWRP